MPYRLDPKWIQNVNPKWIYNFKYNVQKQHDMQHRKLLFERFKSESLLDAKSC